MRAARRAQSGVAARVNRATCGPPCCRRHVLRGVLRMRANIDRDRAVCTRTAQRDNGQPTPATALAPPPRAPPRSSHEPLNGTTVNQPTNLLPPPCPLSTTTARLREDLRDRSNETLLAHRHARHLEHASWILSEEKHNDAAHLEGLLTRLAAVNGRVKEARSQNARMDLVQARRRRRRRHRAAVSLLSSSSSSSARWRTPQNHGVYSGSRPNTASTPRRARTSRQLL